MAALNDVLVVNAGSTSLKFTVVDRHERSRTLASLDQAPPVDLVGHRVVHGGKEFLEPTPIDDTVERKLRELIELAPLHNAPALAAIEQARQLLPRAQHVAVFDTRRVRKLDLPAELWSQYCRELRSQYCRVGLFPATGIGWCAPVPWEADAFDGEAANLIFARAREQVFQLGRAKHSACPGYLWSCELTRRLGTCG